MIRKDPHPLLEGVSSASISKESNMDGDLWKIAIEFPYNPDNSHHYIYPQNTKHPFKWYMYIYVDPTLSIIAKILEQPKYGLIGKEIVCVRERESNTVKF